MNFIDINVMFFFFLNLTSLFTGIACYESCPNMGSLPDSNIPSADYSNTEGLLLSVDSPSQCHGNVTQWNFCYKRSSYKAVKHSVMFMIYRERGNTFIYDRLPSSLTVFTQANIDFTSCMSIPLDSAKQFEIQPNDIVGVCMNDRSCDIEPLLVSSHVRNDAIVVPYIDDHCEDDDLSSLNFHSLSRWKSNYLLVELITGKSLVKLFFHSTCIIND